MNKKEELSRKKAILEDFKQRKVAREIKKVTYIFKELIFFLHIFHFD
jgi:flagellin-specific chaperone FliS